MRSAILSMDHTAKRFPQDYTSACLQAPHDPFTSLPNTSRPVVFLMQRTLLKIPRNANVAHHDVLALVDDVEGNVSQKPY